ncbi:MAG: hypothetical protein GKR87_12735 [Kiritimatiellae bacterium]|nr:hypothetical protein [Kiritimatiellia bacterium]
MTSFTHHKEKGPQKHSGAISLGTHLTAGMVGCSLTGYYIDKKRGGGYAWTLVGMFIGLLYGAYEVWKVVKQIERSENDTHDKNG